MGLEDKLTVETTDKELDLPGMTNQDMARIIDEEKEIAIYIFDEEEGPVAVSLKDNPGQGQ